MAKPVPTDAFERQAGLGAGKLVCGVDEAGRGPLAGPVVAAAVILKWPALPEGLADSKRLSERRRGELRAALEREAEIGVGLASVAEIDRLNILQASLLAMSRAVRDLSVLPDVALIDGNHLPDLACEAQPIVRGDQQSLSIAAASIIAKETRDAIMRRLADECPGYGWENNKGYGTEAHLTALREIGVSRHHRRFFAPVRDLIAARQSES